jgi:hypothetical protein
MLYGFVLPSGDARMAAEFAKLAEQAGWDAFFVWEPVWGTDAWVCLTVAARPRLSGPGSMPALPGGLKACRWRHVIPRAAMLS